MQCFVISSSPSILCKALQEDEICVVRAVESILKTKNCLDKLKTIPFEELSAVKLEIGRIKHEDESISYHGIDLKKHDQSILTENAYARMD